MDEEVNPRGHPKVGSKLWSTTEGTDKAEITDQQAKVAAVFTSRSSLESGSQSFFTDFVSHAPKPGFAKPMCGQWE